MARQDKLECLPGAGKTTAVVSISVNVLSANFPFCMVPAGQEGGRNGKYVDVSGKRFTHSRVCPFRVFF